MLSTPEIQAYIELARGFEPKDAPYLENHRGHLMFVKAEEKRFVSADLIANTSFTASEAEIKKRIEALRGAGYTQFTIQLVPGQEHALADWARIRKALGRQPLATTRPPPEERPRPSRSDGHTMRSMPTRSAQPRTADEAAREPDKTEIERDGDALGGAVIGPHPVDHPCREHHQPAGLGPDALGGASPSGRPAWRSRDAARSSPA